MVIQPTPKIRTIILWSHPRSCSTMFEMAFLQRPDFRVLHEPLGEAFYYGPERMSRRFTKKSRPEEFAKYADLTFEEEWHEITEENEPGKTKTFVKDMAQYIIPPISTATTTPELPSKTVDGNPTVIPSSWLLRSDIKHAFLIRTPVKAVPSYYRLCVPPKSEITGFDFFDPEEVGLRESRMLYDWLVEQGQDPMVIDSATLLKNPKETMMSFCDEVGVQFGEEMLSWEGGVVQEHFKKWIGFHDDAQSSSGIGKRSGSDESNSNSDSSKAAEVAKMPDAVHKAIKQNMADYEYLVSKSWPHGDEQRNAKWSEVHA